MEHFLHWVSAAKQSGCLKFCAWPPQRSQSLSLVGWRAVLCLVSEPFLGWLACCC